jgi:hypothetical protein
MRLYLEHLMAKRERETTSSRSDSHVFSRRDFVARTSLIGAGLVVGPLFWTFSKLTVRGGRMNELQMRAVERTS